MIIRITIDYQLVQDDMINKHGYLPLHWLADLSCCGSAGDSTASDSPTILFVICDDEYDSQTCRVLLLVRPLNINQIWGRQTSINHYLETGIESLSSA